MSVVKAVCMSCVRGARERETVTEKQRGDSHSLHVTPGYTQVLVEEWKLSLLDRCLPTGLSTGLSLTLREKNFIVPEKQHN